MKSDGEYQCTGQLINDFASDLTPYFLTANHCISSGSEASSATVYWFYQTATCEGTAPYYLDTPHSHGTSIVVTSPSSDFSLLMVDGALPTNYPLFWLGWSAEYHTVGTGVTSLHHPLARPIHEVDGGAVLAA